MRSLRKKVTMVSATFGVLLNNSQQVASKSRFVSGLCQPLKKEETRLAPCLLLAHTLPQVLAESKNEPFRFAAERTVPYDKQRWWQQLPCRFANTPPCPEWS